MPVADQIGRMKSLYPGLELVLWRRGLAKWKGWLQPVDFACAYFISISYRLQQPPVVHVLEPVLVSNSKGEPVPHRFSDERLCLYYPKYGEWRADMAIAETIVPWASRWLYYYEVWHATGEWLGGGIEHRPRGSRNLTRASAL